MAPPRPPFVWLPEQEQRHLALFGQIHGAPQRRDTEGQNRWILARGRFRLGEGPPLPMLDLASDGRFRVWCNGVSLGGGPHRSLPQFLRYSTFDLAGCADAGDNLIAVLINLPGRDLGWYETMKGGWQPVFGDGGLFAHLRIGSRTIEIDWRLLESDAWQRDAPVAGWGQNAIEVLDGRLLDPEWKARGFDDASWQPATPMRAEPSNDARARGWGAIRPFSGMGASQTPPLAEHEVEPAHLHWMRLAVPRKELGVEERLYGEQLGPPLPHPATLQGLSLSTCDKADLVLMCSFDPYRVGRPFVEFTARGGETVEIAVDEALPGEFGRGQEGDGLRAQDRLWVARIARYIARPGRQRFEWFHPAGTRALQLVIRDAPDGVVIHRMGLVACHHQAGFEGDLRSGDDVLDPLWQRGRHTVLMCAQDGWIDCPGRECRQWLGDGVVMFDMAACAIGRDIYPLHRQFLDQVAEGQRADGLVRMVSPGDLPAGLTIPDYTLLWLIGIERYFTITGDLASVERWLPSAERALAWLERTCDESGLIADVPEWHFIEWADIDRRGWSLPFNALHAGALKAIGRLARYAGRERLAQDCTQRYARIAEAINAAHWDEARGLYVDSVDPADGQRRVRASQHGNGLALLFDLVPENRIARVLDAITDRTRLKLTNAPPIVTRAGPFDEHRDIVRANSFFAHFVYDALARSGRTDWVIAEIGTLYGPMIAAGATTLWESFEPTASLCHGFSATPVYQLSRHLLGIEPMEPGFATFRINDPGAGVPLAEGIMPTPHGPIHIAWRETEGARIADVTHPAACRPVPGKDGELGDVTESTARSQITFRNA